jgi:hypothetical protein
MANRAQRRITRRRTGSRKPPVSRRSPAAALVATWEDDPGDPKVTPAPAPVNVTPPNLAAQPLPSRIAGTNPAPRVYQAGSPEFRFFAAATSLRRTADFWGSVASRPLQWKVGRVLPVSLDDGVDLNAFYTRGGFGDTPGLHFFHESVSGRTVFSGESPDVVCHEMGHAILDSIRPQLFDAQTIEAAAFHEAFGDISALLSALQIASLRATVLNETNGVLNRNSRLSRLAEQLGAAIRVQHPDAVDRDCLRNAVNSFFYRDPQTLPPYGPASQLTSEPHSFSRVFTAAFLDVLAAMYKARARTGTNELLAATREAAQLLFRAVDAAPVVPDYYSQVGAHMIEAGEQAPFNGRYRDLLKGALVRRGIVSLAGAVAVVSASRSPRRRRARAAGAARERELPKAKISGAAYGLTDLVLNVFTAEEPKRYAVTSSSLTLGPLEPRSPQNAAESYTEDLFQRGRIDVGPHGHGRAGLVHPYTTKTHVVVRQSGELLLRRRTFDCGFD